MAFKGIAKTLLHPILLFGVAVLMILFCVDRYAPARHVPWKPLDLNADLGIGTKLQLTALQLKPRSICTALLDAQASDTPFTLEPKKQERRGCGWEVGVKAKRIGGVSFAPSEMLALCPVTAASYIWLREVDRAATAHLGSGLRRVHHYGTFSCRNIAGTDRLSEHAFANAWDIAGFELMDGRLITVLADWDGSKDRRAFLREARDKACAVFNTALSPDYNAAHEDHFHLDMGPTRSCH